MAQSAPPPTQQGQNTTLSGQDTVKFFEETSFKPSQPLLPAAHREASHAFRRPDKDLTDFLTTDLDVARLNRVHKWLKRIAGRPMPARGLHRQKMMSRELCVTEQADMHMLWGDGRLYLKPLPRYLLSATFWDEKLLCKNSCSCPDDASIDKTTSEEAFCKQKQLYRSALGLLLSYTWLVQYPSDFSLARDAYLLPHGLTWEHWTEIAGKLVDLDMRHLANKRYQFGELRLGRVNMIYRLAFGTPGRSLMRGYYYGYNEYSRFFSHNLQFLVTVFAYATIVLTAMQVGLALQDDDGAQGHSIVNIGSDGTFRKVACWSTVLSLGAIALIIAYMVLTLLVLFLDNLLATVQFSKKVDKQHAENAAQKKSV